MMHVDRLSYKKGLISDSPPGQRHGGQRLVAPHTLEANRSAVTEIQPYFAGRLLFSAFSLFTSDSNCSHLLCHLAIQGRWALFPFDDEFSVMICFPLGKGLLRSVTSVHGPKLVSHDARDNVLEQPEISNW